MAKSEIIIDGNELMHRVTLGFRMPRAFGFRIWLATKLFDLGGWISGLNIVVEFDDELLPLD